VTGAGLIRLPWIPLKSLKELCLKKCDNFL